MPLFHLFISSLRVGAGAPALRTQALDWDSDSQEEENIVVAETQPFVPQTRACRGSRSEGHIRGATQTSALDSAEDEISKQACMEESFQLGLSESSHIQDPDMESTQAFVSVEANQLYASMNASEPDAAQADGDQEEEPATASALPGREGWENLALEATQAYLSDPYQESEEETDDEEKRSITADETQPFYGPGSATLAMAETQPMCVFEEEDMKLPVPTAVQVKVRDKNEPEEKAARSEAAVAQRRLLKEDLSLAETQPMFTRHDSESDEEEDSFPGLRKRKTKQLLQIEDEQTQPLTSSEQSTVETQPLLAGDQDLAPGGSEAFHQDNPVAAQRRGAAALISSDLSTAGTQLMTTGDDEESDGADAVLALPRREAKPLQHQEDETQAAVCEPSLFKSQPVISGEDEDGVDSLPGTEMRKVKPSQILEERLQLLTNSTSSTHETGVLETKEEVGTSGSKVNGRRGTRASSRKVSTQCDEASRRPTRGLKDPSAAARRGTSKSGGENEDELEDKEEEHTNESGGIQSRNDVDVFNKSEQDISQVQKQEEPSLGGDTELRQQEKMEKDRKETEEGEENERIETELSNRLEWERAEREKIERKEKEQWERAGRIQKDTEQLEREKKDLEDKERLERDKADREEKERLEREKNVLMANEQTEQEEKEMLESERRKHDENLGREDQQREAKEVDGIEDQLTEEKTVKKQEQKAENKAKVSARGGRAARRTPVTDTSVSPNDDVPARRTRSRSNSSNSVSSERSALSVNLQESRGRGARRTSDPPRVVASRSSTRRKTVAAHPTHGDSNDDTGRTGGRLRSDSRNSSFTQSPQGQGRGGRQRTRGGKAEAGSPAVSQGDPKPVSRGRKNTRSQSSSEAEKAGSQQATTSRGQRRASSNGSGPAEAKGSSNQGELIGNEEPLQSKKNVRGRSHKAAKREAVVVPQSPAVSSPGETKDLRKGRKRGPGANTDMDSDRSSKFIKGGEMEETPGEAEEAPKQAQAEIPAPAKRRSRASVAQAKKPLTPSGPGLKEANEGIVEKRGRGRLAAGQKQQGEEQEGAEVSAEQRARVLEPEVT